MTWGPQPSIPMIGDGADKEAPSPHSGSNPRHGCDMLETSVQSLEPLANGSP